MATLTTVLLIALGVFGIPFAFVAGIGCAMVAVDWLRKAAGTK